MPKTILFSACGDHQDGANLPSRIAGTSTSEGVDRNSIEFPDVSNAISFINLRIILSPTPRLLERRVSTVNEET